MIVFCQRSGILVAMLVAILWSAHGADAEVVDSIEGSVSIGDGHIDETQHMYEKRKEHRTIASEKEFYSFSCDLCHVFGWETLLATRHATETVPHTALPLLPWRLMEKYIFFWHETFFLRRTVLWFVFILEDRYFVPLSNWYTGRDRLVVGDLFQQEAETEDTDVRFFIWLNRHRYKAEIPYISTGGGLQFVEDLEQFPILQTVLQAVRNTAVHYGVPSSIDIKTGSGEYVERALSSRGDYTLRQEVADDVAVAGGSHEKKSDLRLNCVLARTIMKYVTGDNLLIDMTECDDLVEKETEEGADAADRSLVVDDDVVGARLRLMRLIKWESLAAMSLHVVQREYVSSYWPLPLTSDEFLLSAMPVLSFEKSMCRAKQNRALSKEYYADALRYQSENADDAVDNQERKCDSVPQLDVFLINSDIDPDVIFFDNFCRAQQEDPGHQDETQKTDPTPEEVERRSHGAPKVPASPTVSLPDEYLAIDSDRSAFAWYFSECRKNSDLLKKSGGKDCLVDGIAVDAVHVASRKYYSSFFKRYFKHRVDELNEWYRSKL